MAKDFFKKLVLGVAISLTSVAVISGFTALSKRFQSDESTISIEDSSVEFCAHIGSVQISGVAPTCTEPGLTDGIICGVCHGVVKPQEVLEPLGHTISIIPGVPATCTESGLSEGQYCKRCETVLVEQQRLGVRHNYDDDFNCTACGAVSPSVMKEVDVSEGELVAGNWYRMYRNDDLAGFSINGITFRAYEGENGRYNENFIFHSGPLYYLEDIPVIITDDYIDIYFAEGTYTISSVSSSVHPSKTFTVTASTKFDSVDSDWVVRLVPPTSDE